MLIKFGLSAQRLDQRRRHYAQTGAAGSHVCRRPKYYLSSTYELFISRTSYINLLVIWYLMTATLEYV